VWDSLGDIFLERSKQVDGFHGVDVVEIEACLFGLQHTLQAVFSSIIVEGDSLSVISKL